LPIFRANPSSSSSKTSQEAFGTVNRLSFNEKLRYPKKRGGRIGPPAVR
jgi:hypothetical protein